MGLPRRRMGKNLRFAITPTRFQVQFLGVSKGLSFYIGIKPSANMFMFKPTKPKLPHTGRLFRRFGIEPGDFMDSNRGILRSNQTFMYMCK